MGTSWRWAVGVVLVGSLGLGAPRAVEARVLPLGPGGAPPGRIDADDPLLTDQWALENEGQWGGRIDTDIDAAAAWELTEGAPEILVGVLDTGVAVDHPDLAGVMWVNPGEDGGVPGVDDDLNGCVDDVHGCWFSRDCTEQTPDCAPPPEGARYDFAGHGTAVAGIIAAEAHNGEGGRGVAPGVRIVALHVATPEGYFWDAPVYAALTYAARIGVKIVNVSAYFDGLDLAHQEEALRIAADAGILLVVSAGNWGVDLEAHEEDLPFLPAQADLDAVVPVAAVDRYDGLISYAGWWGSCYGATRVDLAGPSQAIVTTRPVNNEGAYTGTFNGTSASAPFVAGVAALVWSAAPELDALQVKQILLDTVDPVASLEGRTVSGGRVNAGNAVRAALGAGLPPVAEAGPDQDVSHGREIRFSAAGSEDPDGEIVAWRWSFDDGTTAEGEEVRHAFAAQGIYHVTLEVEDDEGNRATDRSVVTAEPRWKRARLALASPHPYSEWDYTEIDLDGARFVRFHLKRLEVAHVDNDYPGDDDALVIIDATGTPLWSRSRPVEDLWTPAFATLGQPLGVWFLGYRGGAWGYEIDEVEYLDGDPIEGCGGCDLGGTGGAGGTVWALLAVLAGRRRRISGR